MAVLEVPNLGRNGVNINQRALPASFNDMTDVYDFFDVVRFWLRSPLDDDQIALLRRYAGGKKMRVWNRPANFNPQFVQRITFYQPKPEALAALVGRNDALINYVEPANDLIFANETSKIDSHRFLDAKHVKRHHGKQRLGYAGEGSAFTRYTGSRTAPLRHVAYSDKHSRITGEVDCLHHEWRINSAAACRAAGIYSFRDLLSFDHRAYWRKHLLLADIDKRKLGKMHRHLHSGERRKPRIIRYGRFTYDVDLRLGATICKALGSTQRVIDHFRGKIAVGRCLLPHDISPMLQYAPP